MQTDRVLPNTHTHARTHARARACVRCDRTVFVLSTTCTPVLDREYRLFTVSSWNRGDFQHLQWSEGSVGVQWVEQTYLILNYLFSHFIAKWQNNGHISAIHLEYRSLSDTEPATSTVIRHAWLVRGLTRLNWPTLPSSSIHCKHASNTITVIALVSDSELGRDFVRGSGVSILIVCCQHHCSRLFMTLHLLIHVGYFRRFNVNEVICLLEEEGH